jgi:protein SCO1/2
MKFVNRFVTVLGLLLTATSNAQPDNSIYQAHIPVTTQSGKSATLDLYRGHPVLITMFYGSCPDVCPMLIMAMQGYEKQLDAQSRRKLRALVVSFDSARDTPEKLRAIAIMHRADKSRWMFASASEIEARKLAAMLNFQYRQKPDGNFDHSVLITLLDAEGRIVSATSKLSGDQEFINAIRDQVRNDRQSH